MKNKKTQRTEANEINDENERRRRRRRRRRLVSHRQVPTPVVAPSVSTRHDARRPSAVVVLVTTTVLRTSETETRRHQQPRRRRSNDEKLYKTNRTRNENVPLGSSLQGQRQPPPRQSTSPQNTSVTTSTVAMAGHLKYTDNGDDTD